ncbi:C-3 sterol dehydrogenase [Cantharellus anzutake]|uniref:C-3 sterol dehydrogenase n=1 Tax=Cantharellus anzutake TaxID=1750568 RepID=UPI0019050D32|nr:C-3 sterol dehydrogenase [Cantharellus anzutake]KAF8316701.1 C-3 sterol dehydrogenase [Cantharellus anzutake]
MPESYLVIGGSGFLGRYIVEALLARGDKNVAVFDVVQRHFDVTFYNGDLTNEVEVGNAIRKSAATCIFHTATPSPTAINQNQDIFYKVNVLGTRTIIAAAAAHGVPKLVYTSSAGNVYNMTDLIGVDERLPIPEQQLDAYNKSKAQAEALVLEANGKEGLHTVALRPAGIFGPGDRTALPGIVSVIKNNQTRIQIGNNNNLFDWTYVGNVVKAHLLAADKLLDPPLDTTTVLQNYPPSITLTTGKYTVPTSFSRPPGPIVGELTPELEQAYWAFKEGRQPKTLTRSKFDPLTPEALDIEPTYPLQVAGQTFFITNGEPMYFWDFLRAMWKALGHENPTSRIAIPSSFGLILGTMSEWFSRLLGREPGFTRGRVYYCNTHRWFNIEKARRVLGYEPDVGIEEGIKRTAAWWKEEQVKADNSVH